MIITSNSTVSEGGASSIGAKSLPFQVFAQFEARAC